MDHEETLAASTGDDIGNIWYYLADRYPQHDHKVCSFSVGSSLKEVLSQWSPLSQNKDLKTLHPQP